MMEYYICKYVLFYRMVFKFLLCKFVKEVECKCGKVK